MLTRKKFAEIFPPTTSPAAAFTGRFTFKPASITDTLFLRVLVGRAVLCTPLELHILFCRQAERRRAPIRLCSGQAVTRPTKWPAEATTTACFLES